MRRALTLIEVLAATVLLGIMASACIPLLQQALRSIDAGDQSELDQQQMRIDLARLADLLVIDPAKHKLHEAQDHQQIQWPAELERSQLQPVTIKKMHAEAEKIEHAWLLLESDGVFISRWLRPPSSPKNRPPRKNGGAQP